MLTSFSKKKEDQLFILSAGYLLCIYIYIYNYIYTLTCLHKSTKHRWPAMNSPLILEPHGFGVPGARNEFGKKAAADSLMAAMFEPLEPQNVWALISIHQH